MTVRTLLRVSARIRTVFLFAVVVAGFGTAFPLNNIAVASSAPFVVACARALFATLALALVALQRRERWPANPRDLGGCLVLGAFSTAIPFAAIAWGQTRLPSSLGGVLFATIPLFTLFLGVGGFMAKFHQVRQVAGAVIGLCGVAAATGAQAHGADWLGVGVTLLAALSYAIGGLLAQRQKGISPIMLAGLQLGFGTTLLIPVALSAPEPLPTGLRHLTELALLGSASTAAPMLAMFVLIRRLDAVAAATATLFIPVVAVVIGAYGLAEPLSWSLVAGLLGVCLGAFLILRP